MFRLIYHDRFFDIESSLKFERSRIQFKDQLSYQGSPRLDINYQFAPKSDETKIKYNGSIFFSSSKVNGIKYVHTFEEISGKINFNQSSLNFNDLTVMINQTKHICLNVTVKFIFVWRFHKGIVNQEISLDIQFTVLEDDMGFFTDNISCQPFVRSKEKFPSIP